jgi:S-DNA-T family DNA segregation ATPase FtsK/SpoIIIE
MRRYGLQPIIVINDGDQLPDLIVVLIGRWLWRYRSEFAPVYLALGTVLTAGVLHVSHPGTWPFLLVIATVTGSLFVGLGHRIGMRRSERLYAATIAMAVGSWCAAATALGIFRPALLRLLLLGGVVLAIPWWVHRRRRARVRVERKLAAWPDIARNIGLTGSHVMSAVVDAWGWTARVALSRGHTVADALNKLPAIESSLKTRAGAVRIEPDKAHADQFVMRVLDTDPHARPVPWKTPKAHSITQPIPLGVFEDATTVTVVLLRRNGLIGGVVGSGKSGVLNVILAALAACNDVVIWGIDLKGGMELRPWTPVLGRLATTSDEAIALLDDAVTELDQRATESAQEGSRVWEPTYERPALVIVIDEYAELPEEATKLADSIARRGRAVAVTLLAATQRPTQKAMGYGATRSQMDVRISLRVRERRDADLILGQGMYQAGWHAHALDAPGKFLISAPEHTHPKRARAYLISDANVTDTVRRHATHRPVLRRLTPNPTQDMHQPVNAPQEASPDVAGLDGRLESVRSSERLWQALLEAPETGVSVPRLAKITGLSRPTLYRRLGEYLKAGSVLQVSRGRYRAASPGTGHPA